MADCYWDALGLSMFKICVLLLQLVRSSSGDLIEKEGVNGLYYLLALVKMVIFDFVCFLIKLVILM